MKKFLRILPMILLILFELAVGVLLFLKPEEVTRTIILILGLGLIVVGIVLLILFFRAKKEDSGRIPLLVFAIFNLIVGLVLAIFPGWIVSLFKVLFLVYGVFMIASGVYKSALYINLRVKKIPASVFMLFGALLSVVLGVIIVVNYQAAAAIMWRVTGVSLILAGILDAIGLGINLFRKEPRAVQ